MSDLFNSWSRSKKFRFFLIASALFALMMLVLQAARFSGWLGEAPRAEWTDLKEYYAAGQHFLQRQDLYRKPDPDFALYGYSPAYAMLFVPIRSIPIEVGSLISIVLHLGVVVTLYQVWRRIFQRLGLRQARELLVWTLPLWFVYRDFWFDINFLNIYTFLALFASLLIDAVLQEKLGWSVIWLTLILLTKPQWAFAAALPLLFGQYRFFIKLWAGAIAAYLAAFGLTLLAGGWDYGWKQWSDYFHFLSTLSWNWPWRTAAVNGRIDYIHSIAQLTIYFMGVTPAAFGVATLIKSFLLLPLALTCLKVWRQRGQAGAAPQALDLRLGLVFALYLAVLFMIDIVQEISLAPVVLAYLLVSLPERRYQWLAWSALLPHALLMVWTLGAFFIVGLDVINKPTLLSAPDRYIPILMIVVLVFYGLLLVKLGNDLRALPKSEI